MIMSQSLHSFLSTNSLQLIKPTGRSAAQGTWEFFFLLLITLSMTAKVEKLITSDRDR